MGWSFRRSVNVGPLRINLSRSGVGYSVGGRGFRTGVRAGGRRYSTLSIPGTGIRYQTGGGRSTGSSGCMVMIATAAAATLVAARLLTT